MLYPPDEHASGHFITLYLLKKQLGGHFIMICPPNARRSRHVLFTRAVSKRAFSLFLTPGHWRGHSLCLGKMPPSNLRGHFIIVLSTGKASKRDLITFSLLGPC